MKRLFFSSLFDKRYILMYVLCITLFYFSFSMLSDTIINYFTEKEILFEKIEILKVALFPLNMNATANIFLATSREIIFILLVCYPIIKIIDLFMSYLSTVLFVRIKRNVWLKEMCKIINLYALVSCLVFISLDVILYIINFKDFNNIFLAFYPTILKTSICTLIIYIYLCLATKYDEPFIKIILCIFGYLGISIFISTFLLNAGFIIKSLSLVMIYIMLLLLYHISLENINNKDIGGI